MREFALVRVTPLRYDQPTYGVLRDGLEPFALTLELPWADNEPNHSCIFAGIYTCKRVWSPKFGNTFEITGVDGRKHVLLHWGSFAADTEGCVLVGERFHDLNADGVQDLAISKREQGAGFLEFLLRTDGLNEFRLHIVDARV